MTELHDAWCARQRARWMRNDAHLWVRPDARRFMPPDAQRALRPDWKRFVQSSFATAFHASLEGKANYDPAQPRVPKNNPGGGQWTLVAGPAAGGGGRGRFGGYFPGATPGELIRLDQAIGRAQDAIAQVRRYDPNWQPTISSAQSRPGSVEAAIQHAEARAEQAWARYEQLRAGIGGNFPPPEPATQAAARLLDAVALIAAYRIINNGPDLFGRPTWPYDKGTVAVAEIGGKFAVGVNSKAPGYTDADWAEAHAWRNVLINKYPDAMKRKNIGEGPSDALYHAEATILLRTARENGWSLAGRSIVVHVDRDMCPSCTKVLPLLARELGNPVVTFVETKTGKTSTLHNARWLTGTRR